MRHVFAQSYVSYQDKYDAYQNIANINVILDNQPVSNKNHMPAKEVDQEIKLGRSYSIVHQ